VALAFVCVALCAVIAAAVYVSFVLRDALTGEAAEHLERLAGLVADRLIVSPAATPLASLVHRLGIAAEVRVTLIGADGRVLADSTLDSARLPALGERPEVAAALRGTAGRDERQPMLYVAVPVPPGAPARVARLAMPLERVEALVASARLRVFGGIGLALGVAIAVSVLIVRRMTRSLGELTELARRMAGGDYRQRAQVTSRDELSALAAAMNHLAEELGATVGRLGEERDLLTAVLDGLQQGVLVVDSEGKIVRVNPALSRIVGVGAEALRRSVIEATRLPDIAEPLQKSLRGGGVVTREFTTRGTPPRDLLLVAAPLSQGGTVAVFYDMTAFRQLEVMRRDFVSNVSHELRTPVTALRGAAETLLDGALANAEQARSFVEVIHRHSERLSELISDLLDLSRIESGEMKLASVPVDLAQVAEEAAEVVQAAARAKDLSLDLDLAGMRGLGDERATFQVLVNLLDNAVKYTPEGGKIRVSARVEDGFVRSSVSDTGPGIAAKHLPRLFERFYRVDPGRSREVGGTGLGLAIVKHLVEAMGGTVRAESELGVGSIFTFTLPLVKESRREEVTTHQKGTRAPQS
jgi:two-component system phosphate regulon sensor histidine kinase PhoR